jgi:hypothetical protein
VIPLTFKNILSNGVLHETTEDNLELLITNLKSKKEWLHSKKINDLLDYFDSLGNYWKNSNDNFGNNLKHISEFLSRKNLEKELRLSLRGNFSVLDDFVTLFDDPEFLYHAQPRGLSVHWIAGNVDVLGIFSVVQALLTKNLCLIKVPHNYSLFKNLILSFKEVSTNKISGKDLLDCITLIYVTRNDIFNQEILSKNANIRIAWGGEEAVSTILSLKKNFSTEDIIYGPKYSYAILDSEFLKDNLKNAAQRLALDISIFDQYACNSPHTIFVENNDLGNPDLVKDFAKELSNSMETVNRLILPKSQTSEKKSMEILSLRTEYDFKGEVFAPKDTDWTVIFSEEDGLANPCFSRVIFVRPIKNAEEIGKFHNNKIQSIGLGISNSEKRKKLVDLITFLGGDRCPSIGNMSKFHSPWDGIFGMDRMVRWISMTNK